MTDKSDSAFRTISEAADEIGVPAHVLRFWETRFPQLQPLKRAGGRRYYRPADMALLRQIRSLLHDAGMTIRGAQLALSGKAAPADPAAPPPRAAASAGASAPLASIDRRALVAIRDRLAAALAA
ncbi:MerR family transcriptional regulator [Sandarakinorhabdus rubra]|uniref:MerR family transcriptional regulator n=1 Tax=Sandarakinorhabdus rubra TaxID=2672568 RepID=UPI0013DB38F9|nr:MerR family transcriptional regulator [Sandarakinorhabdus rubra]